MTRELVFPGYRIEQEIGRGASSTVYLARQESLDREVALKVLSPALTRDDRFVQRFLKERKITARLNHSNIIKVYDFGVHEEHYFLVMELLPGGTLEERIDANMPLAEALRITEELALALQHAHHHGCVHRDIKPLNILFRHNGTAVLTDFGIAKTLDSLTKLTATGVMLGSPRYMSPEQIVGRAVDNRSDLYSLGVLFFQLLTGRLPYDADNVFALASQHATAPIPDLPPAQARFQPLLQKLLAKEPNDRFASVEPFLQALNQVREAPAVTYAATAKPSLPPQPAPPPLPPAVPALTFDDGQPDWGVDVADAPPAPPPRSRVSYISFGGAALGLAVVAVAAGAAYLSLNPGLSQYDPFAARPLAAMTPSASPATPSLETLLLPPAARPQSSALIDSSRYQQPPQTLSAPAPAPTIAEPEAALDDNGRAQYQARLATLQQLLRQRPAEVRVSATDPAAQSAKLAALQQLLQQLPAEVRVAAADVAAHDNRLRTVQQWLQTPRSEVRVAAIDPAAQDQAFAKIQRLLQQQAPEIRVGAINDLPPQRLDNDNALNQHQQLQQRIERLLAQAEQHIEAKHWTTPVGNSAYDSYQAVLELDPNNAAAKQGIARLIGIYSDLAQRGLANGNYQRSIVHARRGLRIAPSNNRLLAMLENAETRLEANQRAERRRQRVRNTSVASVTNGNSSSRATESNPQTDPLVDIASQEADIPVQPAPQAVPEPPAKTDTAQPKKPRIIGTF